MIGFFAKSGSGEAPFGVWLRGAYINIRMNPMRFCLKRQQDKRREEYAE